jgi:hypothetical protein
LIYQRKDKIFDIDCDSCEMRLTEIINSPFPTDKETATRLGKAFGLHEVAVMDRVIHQCEMCMAVNRAIQQAS